MAAEHRIMLVGHPGSGKTTIAKEWAKLMGGVHLSFATVLRRELAVALSATDNDDQRNIQFYTNEMEHPTTKGKYRALMQVWGTEYRRAQDPDYWTDIIRREIDYGSASGNKPVVIDDCRFQNEYAMLYERHFLVVGLESGSTTVELPPDQLHHASEQEWLAFAVDFALPYEPGPLHQAERLVAMLESYSG